MTPGRRAPIRTPPGRWWREARTRYFPRVAFCLCVLGVVLLWRGLTVVPASRTQTILVSSEVPGVLTQINVSPRQPVKSGDSVAAVLARGAGAGQTQVVVTATSDGVISSVYRRAGESVEAGEPIVGISTLVALPPPVPEGKGSVLAEVR